MPPAPGAWDNDLARPRARLRGGRLSHVTLGVHGGWSGRWSLAYPIKSMMREKLNAVEITERGPLGDRAYGVVDASDGKVASAKNPRKWPQRFDFRAAFVDFRRTGAQVPPVRNDPARWRHRDE